MKRIKHRDLTHYFLQDHRYLPRAYLASCERFFRRIKPQAARTTGQGQSYKPQASSLNMNTIK